MGRSHILISLSTSCSCIQLVSKKKKKDPKDQGNPITEKHSFRPNPSCNFCSAVLKWFRPLISSNMLKITPCQDDRNCNSLWTVEHIGTNEKVVYIDGKELKKGQDGIMRIGLGSEIVFWNWKARNQVHGQDQDQDQEESYKIVFRVNDIENIDSLDAATTPT